MNTWKLALKKKVTFTNTEKHSEIITQFTNNYFKSEKRKFNEDGMTTLSDNDQSENDDSEDYEAFLARLDEDGRCIG